ncbi:hypothetical protein FQA39_LY19315 [Lamprigera yunnana]|nr:hypothetical protein FQA39_LY19315 [Lamprigera yunnana]
MRKACRCSGADTPETIAASADQAGATGQKDAEPEQVAKPSTPATKPAWRIQVDEVELRQAQGQWLDESLPLPARLQLDDVAVKAQKIVWPFTEPLRSRLVCRCRPDKGVPSTDAWSSAQTRPRSDGRENGKLNLQDLGAAEDAPAEVAAQTDAENRASVAAQPTATPQLKRQPAR